MRWPWPSPRTSSGSGSWPGSAPRSWPSPWPSPWSWAWWSWPCPPCPGARAWPGSAFFGLLIGLDAARGILYALYRRPETALLSLQADLRSLGVALFGLSEQRGGPALGLFGGGPGRGVRGLPARPPLARARGGDRAVSAGLELVRASRWYGQVIALNDVTTTIAPGVTGLLGPNGAGKSTFLKLLAGQLRPSQGEVRVLGLPAWGSPELFHRVGLCPETDAFWEGLTGMQFVTALLRLTGFDEAECRAPRGGRARADGPARGEGPQDRRLQQGHAPAGEAGPGPGPRPRGAAPRRAGVGHGPRQPAAGHRPRPPAGPRGQDGGGVQPHPPRGGGHDPPRPPHPQRPHPGRGRRARDPRPHGRASPHRRPCGRGTRARWPAGSWARPTSSR